MPHTFTIPMSPESYYHIQTLLYSTGHLRNGTISILGVTLSTLYNPVIKELKLTVMSKPMLISCAGVEGRVREWLKGQGVG